MHPEERGIYFALLTSVCIVLILVVYFVKTIVRYQRRKVSAQLLTQQQKERIQEAERGRIASDLHDEVNSGLSVIKLRLSFLAPDDEEQKRILDELNVYVDTLGDKVRSVSNQLLPVVLERQGLRAALEELFSPLADSPMYLITLQLSLSSPVLPETAIHIYRICQEIVNNIIKHSQANRVQFALHESEKKIYIHVSDNGKGFNMPLHYGQTGLGLQNIRMRADILHAKLYMDSTPGKGTTYDVEIPKETKRIH